MSLAVLLRFWESIRKEIPRCIPKGLRHVEHGEPSR